MLDAETIRDDLRVSRLPPGFHPGGFDCGELDLTEYLCDGTAEVEEALAYSCTYLVHREDELVGYFSILADCIRLDPKERPRRIRYLTAPALKLGRMGIDTKYRGCGIGVWILDYVVGLARSVRTEMGVAVRYVTLDALQRPRLIEWYREYGFVENIAESDTRKGFLKIRRRWRQGDTLRQVSMRFDIMLEDEIATPSLDASR